MRRTARLITPSTCSRPGAILELEWVQVNSEKKTVKHSTAGSIPTNKKRLIVHNADDAVETLTETNGARQSQSVVEQGDMQLASIRKAFAAASKRRVVYATPFTCVIRCGLERGGWHQHAGTGAIDGVVQHACARQQMPDNGEPR